MSKSSTTGHDQVDSVKSATRPAALRVRLALAAARYLSKLYGWLYAAYRALHSGIWLGLLDDTHLESVTAESYSTSDTYGSGEHNRSGLFFWERSAVDQAFPPGATVLVLGAGGGREVVALASMGYKVVGFDPSPELVERGRQLVQAEGLDARMILSPPNQIPAGLEERFDAVLVGWGAYSHIRRRTARVALLRDLRAHVGVDAPMLISFLSRRKESPSFRIAAFLASAIRAGRRSREAIERGDSLFPEFRHHFTADEIEGELRDGGFSVVRFGEYDFHHALCRAV